MTVPADYPTTLAAWREAHERSRTTLDGPLSIVASHDLSPVWTRFDGVPGTWRTAEGSAELDVPASAGLGRDGDPVSGLVRLPVEPNRRITLTTPDGALELAPGPHGLVRLRVRSLSSPGHRAYRGTPWFATDLAWYHRVRLHGAPRVVEVGAVIDGLHHVYQAPGRVAFAGPDGARELTVFRRKRSDRLIVVIRDATSGVTTYPKNRLVELYRPADAAADEWVLDFNRAVNLPCAYNPLLACPLPPPENVLDFAVPVGQRTPEFAEDPR